MSLKGRHGKELVVKYVSPGHLGSVISVQPRYENFIDGMMLKHYGQTKNLLVSYSTKPLGFF